MIKQDNTIYEIWTDKLSKTYGRGQKAVKAVKDIDIIVEPGVHGFLGPNGAGKTSTINMLVGAISITSGKATIRGRNAGSVKTRRLIGFLPQDPAFYEKMTGEQYLRYMAQLNGLKRDKAEKKINELLELLELKEARDRKVEKYSGGMKQRIGIAASLIHDPEILILDEPTANLDPIGRADLIDKIKKLSEKMSVFVSSHILSEIEQMCEKVTMINRGKIVLMDTIKNIKKMHSASSNIFILNTNSNDKILQILKTKEYISNAWFDNNDDKIHIIPNDNNSFQFELPKLLAENNLMINSFNKQESSLQEIFIEIIGGEERNELKNKKI